MLKNMLFLIGLAPASAYAASFPVLGTGAESCESLWVERNQINNVAGYCFETTLGQAVFDNGDCVPGNPALSEVALDRLSKIERAEAQRVCDVNTDMGRVSVNGRYGPLPFGEGGVTLGRWPNVLADLDVFPRATSRERGCTVTGLSSTGDGFLALRSGPDVRYTQIGQLFNGDRVGSASQCMGRWCFSDAVQIGNLQEKLNGWFHVQWCR